MCSSWENCKCKRANDYGVKSLFGRYATKVGIPDEPKKFEGVKCEDLFSLEKMFNVKIVVFELTDDKTFNKVWDFKSPSNDRKELHLNLFDNHFSLIKRLDLYTKTFKCSTCGATYTRSNHLLRHNCKSKKKQSC